MKRRAIPLLLCLALLGGTSCDRKADRDKIEDLEREVRSLNLKLGASNEQRAAELARNRIEREERERQDAWKIADLERELTKAKAKLDVLKDLQAGGSSGQDSDEEDPFEEIASTPEKPASVFGSPTAPVSDEPVESKRPAKALSIDAVVMIEGDESQGTGCIIREGRKYYLYTAAHVLSGNTKLSVTNAEGRKFSKFGDLEAA